MNLIYFAYGNVSVFDSQVVTLLNYYIESNLVNDLVLVIGVNSGKEKVKYIGKGLNKKINILFYKHYSEYPLIEQLTIRSILYSLKKLGHLEKFVIHVRNDVLAYYVYKALKRLRITNPKIIADIRGAGYEQIKEYSNKNRFTLKIKYLHRKKVLKKLKEIKNISFVSDSLKKYIINNIGDASLNFSINSCLAAINFQFSTSERLAIRNKLGLKNDEILFVLSTGGVNAWQNTNNTIYFLVNRGFKVLNLSKSIIDLPNVINLFVTYSEVPKYLSGSDIAIIWREKSITNQVASPVKFSEYICSGLPVVTNDSVDLITNFINENKCGAIINSFDEINENLIQSLVKIDRIGISNIGRGSFGVEKIAAQYVYFYNSVLNFTLNNYN